MIIFCSPAFFIMIVLAILRLISKDLPHGSPSPVLWSGVTTLFGCGVYSFMCHHSLPSVVTPMRNKARLIQLTGFDLMVRARELKRVISTAKSPF